jgi:penicillin-binding protein 1C
MRLSKTPDLQNSTNKRTLFGWLGISLLASTAVVLTLVLFASILSSSFITPPFEQVYESYRRSDAVLLDRHREVIHELRVSQKGRRLDWVPLEEVSPALQSALLHAEDKRFYEHNGADWRAIGSALWEALSSGHARGASTITMQLASHLRPELQPQSYRRSTWQKWKQVQAARAIEKRWSKAQILEAYLNLVTFRGELQGVASAARGLFKKQPHGLGNSESMILAALVRSPNASPDQVALRACQLSEAMGLHLDCAAIASRARGALSAPYVLQSEVTLAPHVAGRLLRGDLPRTKGGSALTVCTLDGRLQRLAAETLQHHLLSVRSQNVQDGSVLVVENKTGEVLAYVGNAGGLASARYVDGTQALRQAGSILKPFLYGLAFGERLLTPASLIDDSPLDFPAVNGIYRPENYDNQFHGLVTARTALASSLNIPAVKALNLVGVDAFIHELGALGFRGLRSADFYGPSLALGSADIALWDLVNAYRCLANRGIWRPLRMTFGEDSGPPRHRVFSPEVAFMISDILSDRESRSRTFSLESPLSTRFWSAVKTGTSKDMRDNWCVGYSSQYTVGVWTGNFSGRPMWNVSGITGAAPVWVEIMNWLHRHQTSDAPNPPPGLVARNIAFSTSDQSRREWFLKGTETRLVQEASSPARYRISYPANGTVIALDPDIPNEEQKLFFESQPTDPDLHWRLNGFDTGLAGSPVPWGPRKGKYALSLLKGTRIVDSIYFEVRGNLGTAFP